jgi:carbonic anhydrase
MGDVKHLLDNNEKLAAQMQRADSGFFGRLAAQQKPQYLWIGCSDSRVPANEITGLLPGEIFVHRNVANIVHPADLNALSVLQNAVDVLREQHVLVVGHYGCGGIQAALEEETDGLIDHWLASVRRIRRRHKNFFDQLPDSKSRSDNLCELNVIDQVVSVSQTTIVRRAWKDRRELSIHGWIYAVQDGRLRDLNVTVSSAEAAEDLHQRAEQKNPAKLLYSVGRVP